MTPLQTQLDKVRNAWRRTEMLKGAASLTMDVLVVVLAMLAIDMLYHLPAAMRGIMLAGGLASVAFAIVWVIVLPLKKEISDGDLALYVEGKFPELKGTLISAAEYEQKPAAGELQAALVDALVVDCLDRASKIDLTRVFDKRRMIRRAIAAGVLLAFFVGGVAVQPQVFSHEAARVLSPWIELPLTEQEQAQLRMDEERRRRKEKLLKEIEDAKKPVVIEFTVAPGNAEVARGAGLSVEAHANKITGPLFLKFRSGAGEWRTLDLTEDPSHPEKYTQELRDISDDLSYKVEMGSAQSQEYAVKVYDPTTIKNLKLVYHYPKYTELPDRTVAGMDGNIEAVEGTEVELAVQASESLRGGRLTFDAGPEAPMSAKNEEATAVIKISKNGGYGIEVVDKRGAAVRAPTRYAIHAIEDEPPTLEVISPAGDEQVHPMEEIAFVAKAEDTVGLKEIRLHTLYNSENEVVQRVACKEAGRPLNLKLAEFTLDMEQRTDVSPGDTILFHFESEDTKGQVTSSDIYSISVRPLEALSAYEVMHGHPESEIEMLNVIAAAWNLRNKKATMSPEEFKKECEKIGRVLAPADGQ